jgi:hypothetical protein
MIFPFKFEIFQLNPCVQGLSPDYAGQAAALNTVFQRLSVVLKDRMEYGKSVNEE